MIALGVDTSSALSSVALVEVAAAGRVIATAEHLDPRRHAEAIGPLLARIRPFVDPDRLDVVACGVGPGPYTGLRVGVAAAIALGAAWGVPVVGVCSLDAVADAARAAGATESVLGVALDARRKEVYWARYDRSGARIAGPRVGDPAAVGVGGGADPGEDIAWYGAGAGGPGTDVAGRAQDGPAQAGPAQAGPVAFPHATWIAIRAARALAGGQGIGDGAIPLDRHGTDTGATADCLQGAVLLPPRPLYLRRPDVTTAGGVA